MSDDFSSDIYTKGQLVVGHSATGNFETSYDRDWFHVQLNAGVTYVFGIEGAPQGGGSYTDMGNATILLSDALGKAVGYGWSQYGLAPSFTFTADRSGDYLLGVANGYLGTGTYSVTAALPAADDFRADIRTSGHFGDSNVVTGVLERGDDVDWFKFHADAGQMIGFSSDTPATVNLEVYDAKGQSAGFVLEGGVFQPPLSGDYYLAVNGNGYVGGYTQTMHVVTDDYPVDAPGRLEAGGELGAALDYYGDTDQFHVSVQAGQVYALTISMPAGESRVPAYYLLGADGTFAGAGVETVDGKVTLRFLATHDEDCMLYVYNYVNMSTALHYTLSLGMPVADDYGGTRATAPLLAPDAPLSGSVQSPDDVDLFHTELAAGVTYTFSMGAGGGQADTQQLLLQDASGNVVASASMGQGRDFSYTPNKAGAYYLQASGYTGASYTVSVAPTADDFGANVAGAGTLAVGGSASGELDAGGGDRDWFAVSLNAGTTYWFSLNGSREGAGTLLGGYAIDAFRLVDASGKVLVKADAGYNHTAAILPFTPTLKGTYYLDVGAQALAGTYTLTAQLGQKDDYGNDAAHAGALSFGKAVSGKLELSNDIDVFKISAVAGQTVALELAATGLPADNFLNSATLMVTGANGVWLRTRTPPVGAGDKLYQVIEFAQSGDYFVKVASQPSTGQGGLSVAGAAGGYRLTATDLGHDDYANNALTTAVLASGGKLQGVVGTFDDHDWIKVHLEAGRSYVFDLHGKVGGGGTLDASADVAGLSLLGPYGLQVAAGVNAGSELRLSYVAGGTGDFYLDVRGAVGNTGSYTLEANQLTGDVTAPLLTSATVAAGATNVGLVQPIELTFNENIMLGGAVRITDANGVALGAPYNENAAKVAGHTLTLNLGQALVPGMTYTLGFGDGTVLDVAGNHYLPPAKYSFTTVKPASAGTGGNDYLLGTGYGDTLNGGAGVDTVYYKTPAYRLTITHNADGSVGVRDLMATFADQLTNIERLQFSDHVLALDVVGVGAGGQAYRLYQAAFDRTPDGGGLGFWINALDKGMSLNTVAQNFIGSDEFKTRYGAAPSDADFVTNLYHNVLHRDADAGGNTFWIDRLHDGVSRADVLVAFSEGTENQAAIAKIIGNGFEYTPYA